MKYVIQDEKYGYISNALQDKNIRESYFNLAKKVFKLDFSIWYNSGFCGSNFIPYALLYNGIVVASVGVSLSDMKWQNQIKRYVQISTVMTDPEYRGKGLNRYLLELVLQEWKNKCDSLYLYANDSVVDFYPKFGFERAVEYRYHQPVVKTAGNIRKLNLSSQKDIDLLIQKYKLSNPFSKLTMENNPELLLFHCLTFLYDDIYYVEQYDAVIIATFENDELFCYDVYTDSNCQLSTVIGAVARESTKTVTLGFTPKFIDNWVIDESQERNTTVFVLSGKENLFNNNKVTFPFLSRA